MSLVSPRAAQLVSLQRQLNACSEETVRYTQAAERRRQDVEELSKTLQEETRRLEDAEKSCEELQAGINDRCDRSSK